jgi:hypothetical protein
MSDVPVMTPAEWRNFGTRFPITACRITREDLKRLYKLINERQAEYREKIVAIQSQQSQETPEAFAARRRRVYNAHVTSVTIEAKNGERLTGNNEQIFDAVTYWADVKSVFFSTQSVPQAVIGVSRRIGWRSSSILPSRPHSILVNFLRCLRKTRAILR